MGERRKVFRIEETADALRLDPQEGPQPAFFAEILQELTALRAFLEAAPGQTPLAADAGCRDEVQRLKSELRQIHSALNGRQDGEGHQSPAPMARIASELEAVVSGSERATQKILAAAEDIDQAANNLSAALRDDAAQGLAQDIRDRVIQIFEACNYQDLTGQHVAKVMTMLGRIERQIARALKDGTGAEPAPPPHGPRLPDDRGHASQSDIDSMFAADSAPMRGAAVG